MQATLIIHDGELNPDPNHITEMIIKLVCKPNDIYLNIPDIGLHYNIRISVTKRIRQYIDKYRYLEFQIKIYDKVYDIYEIEFYKNRARLDIALNRPG